MVQTRLGIEYIGLVARKSKKKAGETKTDERIGKMFVLSEANTDLMESTWTCLDNVVEKDGKEKMTTGVLYIKRPYLFLGCGKSHGRRRGIYERESAVEHHFLANKVYRLVFHPSRFFKIFKQVQT